jgi:hypothetical protein
MAGYIPRYAQRSDFQSPVLKILPDQVVKGSVLQCVALESAHNSYLLSNVTAVSPRLVGGAVAVDNHV